MNEEIIEIKSYLSEKLDLLNKELNRGENILLVSPTDTGKTRAIIQYAKNNPQKRIAILSPTQALVDNLKESCDVPAGYGSKWAKTTKFYNLLVTTYDSIQFFDRDRFDAIFIDEAHYLAQAGSYRVKALEYMMSLDCQIILVTATPNVIERLDGFNRLEFYKKSKPKEIIIYNQRDSEINLASTIIQNRNHENLLIIRINNKEIIDNIHEKYPDLVITKIYSDKEQVIIQGQDEESYRNLRKGTISKSTQVVLTTSIMDCGLSLEVQRDVDCFAIGYNNVINPIDAIQLSARVRSNSKYNLKLSIIGPFDDYNIIEYPINSAKGRQQFELMSNEFESLSRIHLYFYTELLSQYNIIVEEKLPMKNLVRVTGRKSRSKILIANNFNSTNKYFEIEDKANNYGYADWLDNINGDETKSFKEDTMLMRVFSDLIEAIEKGVAFKFFIKDKYYDKILSNLVYCVDNYWKKDSLVFKEQIDLFVNSYWEGSKTSNISISLFSELTKQEQNAIKQLANLLFKSRNSWNSSTKLFTKKSHDKDVDNYILNLTAENRFDLCYLSNAKSNAIS